MIEHTRRTVDEILAELGPTAGALGQARRLMTGAMGHIEQAMQQRIPMSPIEARRIELETVEAIWALKPSGWRSMDSAPRDGSEKTTPGGEGEPSSTEADNSSGKLRGNPPA